MPAPSRPPKPLQGPTAAPLSATLGNQLRLRDPYKELADQRARPFAAPASTPQTTIFARIPAALQPDAAPRPARFLYELGLTLAAMGENPAAITALRQATTLKPSMSVAWRKLADLLERTGDQAGADAALAALATIATAEPDTLRTKPPSDGKLDAAYDEWARRLRENPPEAAGAVLRDHLRNSPTDIAALRALADIGRRQGFNSLAQLLIERALELAPHYIPARMEYVATLMAQARAAAALPHLERLIADEPRNQKHRFMLAMCLADMGAYDRSLIAHQAVMADVEKDIDRMVKYSYVLRYAGKRAESTAICRRCIERKPDSGKAWWGLANLKNETFTEADLDAMRWQEAHADISADDRIHMNYALGAALEQIGAYEESFGAYSRGAALKRAEMTYGAEILAGEMARACLFYTAEMLDRLSRSGHEDPAPIFILGLPRVGSTLIEQILASHSAVEGTHELRELSDLASDIGQFQGLAPHSLYPQRLATMKPATVAALGARYIADTRIYRRTERPFFIDKMPGNWLHVGLIHSILPNAKIIDARRHPMASGFAAFKQLFGVGMEYSYDLTEIGRHYALYVKTMAHYDMVLPGRVHRVMYESMVTDTEAEIRRLLEYCGLNFETGCLRFWETQRAVATPSAEQVRRPISRASMDQWRNYEPWLSPLRTALENADTGPLVA